MDKFKKKKKGKKKVGERERENGENAGRLQRTPDATAAVSLPPAWRCRFAGRSPTPAPPSSPDWSSRASPRMEGGEIPAGICACEME